MSLINQMLKDLEQRGAGSNNPIKINPAMLSTGVPQSRSFPLIKIGVLLALLAGGVYSWMHTAKPSADSASPAPALAPVPSANKPAEASQAPATETTTNAQPNTLFATQLDAQHLQAITPPKKAPAAPMPATSEVNVPAPVVPVVEKTTPLSSNEVDKSPSVKHTAPKLVSKQELDTGLGKQIRPEQKSNNYYRLALAQLQQGRVSEAQANLSLALESNPANQEARQTLAGLLLENKRQDEAKAILTAGLAIAPEQNDFRMAIARLQVEAGDRSSALNTLEQGLGYANNNADYQVFTATLLQSAKRHDDAVQHYMTALALRSNDAKALIGLGISLQALGKLDKAQEAFNRAQATATLSPELTLFVEQQLKQLNSRSKPAQ